MIGWNCQGRAEGLLVWQSIHAGQLPGYVLRVSARAGCLNASVLEEDDAVGPGGDIGVVGHHEDGLAAADGQVEEVHDLELCTMCWFGLFFSHRRDGGVTGRQAGVVWRS